MLVELVHSHILTSRAILKATKPVLIDPDSMISHTGLN